MINFPLPQGLRHVLLLDGTGGVTEFNWGKVGTWLPEQGCLWLHFDFEDAEVGEWLRQHSGLGEVAVDALLSDEIRPRTQVQRDQLLLALRGVNLNPGSDPEDMVSIRLWTDGRRVISTRRRQLLSVSDLLERLEAGDGPVDAGELIVELVERIVMRMSDTVDDFEDKVLELEECILSEAPAALRSDLALLRKQSIAIRRYLAPQREALNRLVMEKLSWLTESYRLRLREITDRLIRHIEDIDAVRDRAAVAQEQLQSRLTEQTNERMYVLSVVAAIFLPLSFFTGLMGINVGGMPGVEDPAGFWMVVGLCVALSVLLAAVFRWRKWF
jgi:zinc transporter